MEQDSSSTNRPVIGFSSAQLAAVNRYFDKLEKRIVMLSDQDSLATMNSVFAELYRKRSDYYIWARYWYLQEILIDMTRFTYPGGHADISTERVSYQLNDSYALHVRYAVLHYGTMHRIATRHDKHADYFSQRAQYQADVIIGLAPDRGRTKWLEDVLNQVPSLSTQAACDLTAQVIKRYSPTGKERLRVRLLRRVKSP